MADFFRREPTTDDEIAFHLQRLNNWAPAIRRAACARLGSMPVIPQEAIAALQHAVRDPDADVAEAARTALVAHGYGASLPSVATVDWASTGLPEADNRQQSVRSAPVERASFWRRFWALQFDLIILGLVVGVLTKLGIPEDSWLGLALYALYFIWAYSTTGQTLGKLSCGIKVVSIDGSPLNWRKGVLRTVGYILSSIPLDLGYLWAIWDGDKQAWHDKIAGTCVVPASVAREQLQGTIDPAEAHRRQRRWLLGAGITTLIILASCGALLGSSFLRLYQSGTAEMKALGTWPGPAASPEELIRLDLSSLGLTMGQIRDARSDPQWASPGWGYEEGSVIDYKLGETIVVSVWALKHEDEETAGNNFRAVADTYFDACGSYAAGGRVIHCAWSDAYDKIFWNNMWIVGITAKQGTEFTPDVLVDKVRDALAAHWMTLARSSP